jgi:hypothetical protein
MSGLLVAADAAQRGFGLCFWAISQTAASAPGITGVAFMLAKDMPPLGVAALTQRSLGLDRLPGGAFTERGHGLV